MEGVRRMEVCDTCQFYQADYNVTEDLHHIRSPVCVNAAHEEIQVLIAQLLSKSNENPSEDKGYNVIVVCNVSELNLCEYHSWYECD